MSNKWDAQKERDLATALFIATGPHPAEVKQKVIEMMAEAGHIVNWDATRYVNCIDMFSLLWEFPRPSLVVVPLGGLLGLVGQVGLPNISSLASFLSQTQTPQPAITTFDVQQPAQHHQNLPHKTT